MGVKLPAKRYKVTNNQTKNEQFMKNKALDILNFWLSCVREQDIQKTELSRDINAHQFIELGDEGRVVSNQRDSVKISISLDLAKLLRNQRKSLMLRNVNDTRPIFFFPLVEIKGKLSPLFFVDLSDYEKNILTSEESVAFDINPWSVDTKIGVVTDTFVRLGYDEDNINLDYSIIAFIEKLTGDYTLSFDIAMNSLLKMLEEDSAANGSPLKIINKGVLKYSDFSESTLIFKKDILTFIENRSLQENHVFQDFLYRTEDKSPSVEHFYLGSFQSQPLSSGQATALSIMNKKDESIVAVQGPPGTGKTTMLMSSMASEITQRAISLAKGEDVELRPILATSYTNKAVENIIELLEAKYPEEMAWALNINLGNREKRLLAVKRIKGTIKHLSEAQYSPSEYNNLKDILLSHEDLFESSQYNDDFDIAKIKNCLKYFEIDSESIQDGKDLFNAIYRIQGSSSSPSEVISKVKAYQFDLSKKKKEFAISFKTLKKEFDTYSHLIKKYQSIVPNVKQVLMSGRFYEGNFASVPNKLSKNKKGIISKLINFLSNIIGNEPKVKSTSSSLDLLYREVKLKKLVPRYTILKTIESMKSEYTELGRKIEEANEVIEELQNLADVSPTMRGHFRVDNAQVSKDLFDISLKFFLLNAIKNKSDIISTLKRWETHVDPNKEASAFSDLSDSMSKIGQVYPLFTSTLSSISNIVNMDDTYLLNEHLFSLSICDESGMVPVFCMPTLILRSLRLMIVGDQKQLSPVINIDQVRIDDFYKKYKVEDPYNLYHPLKASAFQRSAYCTSDKFSVTGNSVILDEHRRCLPDISSCFIDIAQYSGLLNKTDVSETKNNLFSKVFESAISSVHVDGDSGGRRNVNIAEIRKVKSILMKLKSEGVDITKQVGIITPFQNQSILLQSEVRNLVGHTFTNKKIGTIHAFQGTEFDIIIVSMVVYNDNFNVSFINNKPNMLNVAVSRARYRLVVVGDIKFLEKSEGNISKLLKHAQPNEDFY